MYEWVLCSGLPFRHMLQGANDTSRGSMQSSQDTYKPSQIHMQVEFLLESSSPWVQASVPIVTSKMGVTA